VCDTEGSVLEMWYAKGSRNLHRWGAEWETWYVRVGRVLYLPSCLMLALSPATAVRLPGVLATSVPVPSAGVVPIASETSEVLRRYSGRVILPENGLALCAGEGVGVRFVGLCKSRLP